MRKTNKKVLLSLSVLATPFVAENLVGHSVAKANSTYNLTQNVKVYTNAQNAARQVKSTKTYASGTYYVYKEYNGMINISRTKGKPGAWINPATNKPVVAPQPKLVEKTTTKVVTSTPKKEVDTKTQVPTPAITTQKQVEKTTAQQQKQTTKSNTYTLNNSVKAYTNAAAAKTQKGAKSTYTSGNYFIFKEFNGMMNISRVAGRAGAWINPLENKVLQAKVEIKATKPAEIKAAESKTTTQKPVATKVAENKATEQKPAEVKVTENKATEQKPAEVKVTENKVTEQKPAEVKATENKAKEQKPAETKVTHKQGDTFVLKHTANTYSNAVDASKTSNSGNTYGKGTYYVYKTHNGMINISRTRGKAGAWINPNEKESTENVLTVLPFASKTYRITSPYAVARNISSIGLRDVHKGVDFVTGNNKEAILSTEDGVVVGAGLSPFGDGAQYVTIKHAENSFTSYWHLANNSITVRKGDKVKAGQKIGTIGTTGWSTGIHLHFMHATTENVYVSHQDPMKYLRNLSKKNKTN